jgi:hypothetical protein
LSLRVVLLLLLLLLDILAEETRVLLLVVNLFFRVIFFFIFFFRVRFVTFFDNLRLSLEWIAEEPRKILIVNRLKKITFFFVEELRILVLVVEGSTVVVACLDLNIESIFYFL